MSSRLLTWLPIAAALAVPAPLLAQDWTPTGERILSDPTYLPLHGQLYGESGYNYDSTSSTQYDASGASLSIHSDSNVLNQYFEYGVTNDLSVNIGDTYSWTNRNYATSTGGSYQLNANGFDNPTFGVTFRALDQLNRQPLDVDLSASYAPNFIGARTASIYGNGNEAPGGDVLNLKLAIARETRFFTVQGYFDATYLGQTSSYNALGDSFSTSSYWQPRIGIGTQTRFNDRISLNVFGEYDFAEHYNQLTSADIASGRGPAYVDRGDFGDIGAALNYHFIPNRLVGSVVYSHTFYSPIDASYVLSPADNYSVQRSGNTIGGELRYVFW